VSVARADDDGSTASTVFDFFFTYIYIYILYIILERSDPVDVSGRIIIMMTIIIKRVQYIIILLCIKRVLKQTYLYNIYIIPHG
jgi:hypothetical protein